MKAILLLVGLCCAVNFVHAKPASAKSTAAAKSTAGKAVEEEPTIPGVNIARPDGSFLGVTIAEGTFKLSFFDSKKKPMHVDVSRALARWSPKNKIGGDLTVLNRGGDATSLGGGKPVRPPYFFKLYLTLLRGDGDDAQAVETYVVDFQT